MMRFWGSNWFRRSVVNDDALTENTVIVLVDSDVLGDKRVERVIEEFGPSVKVVDLRDGHLRSFSLIGWIRVILFLVRAFLNGLVLYPILRKDISIFRDSFFSGGKACLFWLYAVDRVFHTLKQEQNLDNVTRVYSNDLYCGVLACSIKKRYNIDYIYDAHELEICRNRRVGVFRLISESGIEQIVLRNCIQVRVVNHKISQLMSKWYDIPVKIKVCYNDFYSFQEINFPKTILKPNILYVGKGVRGRFLELLENKGLLSFFDVSVFLLGSKLPSHIKGNGWYFGKNDYHEELIELVKSTRCVMWCCLENYSLSYKLATPNKFFQALAVGIPIVAYKGTYLAEIVLKYNLGVVIESDDFQSVFDRVCSGDYLLWVRNLEKFRLDISNGDVEI